MPKAEIRFSNTPGRIPTIEELEGFKFGWNIYDAILYGVEEIAGVKTVVPIGGGGGGSDHPRAHQIDSIEDHPPVPEGKRGKIVATHPVTGAIVLIDPVTGDLTHYCYIAWRDAPGDGFTMIPNMSLQYEAILFTHEEITSPVEADFDGCWRERVIDKQALPPGGITDQALVKKTDDDYDVEWKTVGGGDSYEYWRLKGSSVVEVKFGLLYNWYAATDARKITSSDTWRVTESADWKALLLDLGGIDQGSIVRSELPDEFGQFPLKNHYPLCDSDPQYWNTFVGTNTLNFNFRGSGCRFVLYDEEAETINTYFDNKGDYGYSLCSDTSNGNELFIYIWELYSVLFLSFWSTSPTAKKTGYPIRLVRPATAEELLLSDGTACDPYTGNDGKSYRTVKLLDLVWIADNLAETKFRNGDYIPGFDGGVYTPITNEAWAALTTSALCAYNDNLDNAFIPFISSEIHVNSHDLVSFKDSATVEFSVTENEDGEKEITAEAIGGGAATFLDLTDTPSTYAGQAGKVPQVNSAETGLEWGSGGGGSSYEYWKLKGGKVPKYGLLYNWYAATDARNICAEGWEVPTTAQWTTLRNSNWGFSVIGGKLKETGLTHWITPNTDATNELSFNGRGSGYRTVTAEFSMLKEIASFWAISDKNSYSLSYETSILGDAFGNVDANIGISIRLIKTTTTLTDGQSGTYTGNDGKVYRTICIGTQEWLADNLCETKYRNGDAIPEVTDNAAWAALTTAGMCAYNNDWDNVFMQNDVNINSHDRVTFKDSETIAFEVVDWGSGQKQITAFTPSDGTPPVADGTYTVGIGSTQNGTITTKGGIITAIQEAI